MVIIVADPDQGFRARVTDALEGVGEVVQAAGTAEILNVLDRRARDGGVVALGPDIPGDRVFALAERIQEAAPRFNVVTLATNVTSELLREGMRAGVRDVLPRDFDRDELREAVKRAASQIRPEAADAGEPPKRRGRIITIFSSKGGSGKSFVASNLAVLLARDTERDIALVDLDLGSGDLAIMFQIMPSWTIHDAAEKIERLDMEALGGFMAKHPTGVHLLAAPPEPSLAEAVSGEAVTGILELLRDHYPFVIVDGPPSFTDQVLAALDATDELILVTGMDVPSIKNLKLALHTLEQLGWSRDRTRLVLNRADSKVGLRTQDVEKSLGTSIDVAIPSSRDVPLSVNEGQPIVAKNAKSPVIESLQQLSDDIRDEYGVPDQQDGDGDTDGGLRRWFRRG